MARIPDPLAPRRPASLRRQARRELGTAYRPVYRGLKAAEGRVRALDTKRAADEQAFKDWMVEQQNTIRTTTQTRIDAIRTQAATHHQELVKQLTAARGPGPGLSQGGEPPPAGAVDPLIAGAQQSAIAASGSANAGLDASAGLSDELIGSVQTNNLAYAASLTAKRKAQTLDQLSKVADARQKADLQRAADTQRRIAQLLDNEIKKRQIRIAASQFDTRLTNQNEQNKLSRGITRAGQKGTQDRFNLGTNKWGYTHAEWAGMSLAQRNKVIADQKALPTADQKSKGKGKGLPTRSQFAHFDNAVQKGLTLIQTDTQIKSDVAHAHQAFKQKNLAAWNKYKSQALLRLMNSAGGGMSADAAYIAIFRSIYPHGKLPKSVRGHRTRGARGETSSGPAS